MLNKILNFKIEVLLLLIGMLFGISYYFIPIKYIFLFAFGLVGAILVFWKLEIGIFSAVFLLPFLPTMLIIGIILLVIFSFIIKVILNKIKLKHSPLDLWLAIFGAIILLFSIFSITQTSSLKVAFVFLSYIALYFVTIHTVTNKRILYFLLLTLISSASLEALYGIYQYKIGVLTSFNNWTDTKLFPDMKTRVFGTLDNPNILAQYLEFTIPISLGLFWSVKDYIKKFIFLGLSGIMILSLIFTYSRGGWIAFALSMIVFGILKDRRILLVGGLFGLISINFLPTSIMERITSIGNLSEASNSYRTFLWAASLDIIKDYWLGGVGVGVEAFQKIYTSFYIREGVFAYHVHNLYLEILIETGILGFFGFLAIIFTTYSRGLISLIKTQDNLIKTIIASLLGGMTAFLFHGITENSFYNFKIVFLFWFIISLIMSINQMDSDENPSANNNFKTLT